MSRGFWRAALAIVAKDLRVEMRSRELLSAMAIFALLCILVFSFALELDRVAREEAVSGVLWVTLIFASMLGLGRSLAGEIDGGTLDGLLLAPVSRRAIYAGKLLGNALFTLLVGACLLPLSSALFNQNLLQVSLVVTTAVGGFGICAIGTLTALLTLHARSREALLPIAMLPLALPLLLPAVRATTGILNQSEWMGWLQLLGAVCLLYLALCGALAGFVLEE